MSEYPKCHHGFNDPNGLCKQCVLEGKIQELQENTKNDKRQIEIYRDALNLILRADVNLGVSYAKGIAESALEFRHYMKASENDPDNKMSEAIEILERLAKRMETGCSSNRCKIVPPQGQTTNGPCHCVGKMAVKNLRRAIQLAKDSTL